MNKEAIKVFTNSLAVSFGECAFGMHDVELTNKADKELKKYLHENKYINLIDYDDDFVNELRTWATQYEKQGFIKGFVFALEKLFDCELWN